MVVATLVLVLALALAVVYVCCPPFPPPPYSPTVHSLRGVGLHVNYVVAEEFAAMDPKIINVVLLPIIARAHTLMLAISSMPVDENSAMYQFMDARYPESGKRIVKTIIFGNICASCSRKGKSECQHVVPEHWSNKQQARKIRELMKGQKEIYMREMLNEKPQSLLSTAFPRDALDALLDSENDYAQYLEHPYVFVGLDPNGGGNKSRCSIVDITVKKITDDAGNNSLQFIVRSRSPRPLA